MLNNTFYTFLLKTTSYISIARAFLKNTHKLNKLDLQKSRKCC